MSRWEPNARERLLTAALDLFAENGFEQTTAADIAARAGVTERTFFRHFPDKREALFDREHVLDTIVGEAIAAAPSRLSPLAAALAGVAEGGALFAERRERVVRRARVVAAHPSLRERELLKLADLTEAIAAALRDRGTAAATAELAAHSAVAVFHVAFRRWVSRVDPPEFAACVAEVAAEQRALSRD